MLGCTLFITASAQTETHTEFITWANFIFANLGKILVPHGLLLDYAMELADPKKFNCTLTYTNKGSAGILRDTRHNNHECFT